MRRAVKVKALATSVPLRRAAPGATSLARRSLPAWIAADEGTVAFTAKGAVTARVRDGLVLRKVSKKTNTGTPHSRHVPRAR